MLRQNTRFLKNRQMEKIKHYDKYQGMEKIAIESNLETIKFYFIFQV